jgi:hypothetical protein
MFPHDLAVPHFGEQDTRHHRPSPGRWDGPPRDRGEPFAMGTAHRPVYKDLITLGYDTVDLEVRVGEGYYEAPVIP